MQNITPDTTSFGFYAVLTDPLRGYEYCTRMLVEHEIAFVQLRMKHKPVEVVRDVADKMRAITAGTKTRFIVNDDPVLARSVGADGVHIGQTDMPFAQTREIMGQQAIIGLSTHSPKQVIDACSRKPTYIGAGPVYATPTKENPDPVIGLAGLSEMMALATVPAVAIGGITLENLPLVLEAGARNFCMVRPITLSMEPEKVLKQILGIYTSYCKQ
jgi:thiamine-phosphate pyrophosphorylase